MAVKADLYHIVLRFPRLFPDPAVFEDPSHLAKRYLLGNGLSGEKSDFLIQSTEEIVPVDDQGKPSVASGTSKYSFEGRSIMAEYMSNASIRIAYADIGTGLDAEEHSRLWSKGKLGGARFELRELKHQSTTLNLPDVSDLYKILKERATPNTLSTVELDAVAGDTFRAVLAYVRDRLSSASRADGLEAEVYAAKDLSASEKTALEKRIGRESSNSTIFVILSRRETPMLHSKIG